MHVGPALGRLTEPLSGRSWSPAEVRAEVARRHAFYRARGLGRGDRVFLGYGNRLEFFADLLAIWQAGACAVPLDSRWTAFEIDTLAAAASPRLFLHQQDPESDLVAALAARDVQSVDTSSLPALESPIGFGAFSLDDDALILFTSGTTGDPKGVVHTHRSLRARWMALRQALGLRTYRRTLCLLPTHFGHGLICNCLFPWLAGQDLYVLPPFSPDVVMRLGTLIDEHAITFMSSVPSVWRLALKTARPPSEGSLERISCGSAPLSAHLWQAIADWAGTPEVFNTYGITETGSWVAGTTGESPVVPEDGLIGEAWGAEIAVMKSDDADSPPGVGEVCAVGEIGFVWLSTPALMRGYLGRDDLTREVVRAGWFLTGDLGSLDERGRLHLNGRVREEINKGGMKVHPTDIDSVVERFEPARDVCCFAYEDELYGQNVGVALVLEESSAATLAALYEWLKRHLAEHQMPVRWYVVDEIARTSRGKINRDLVAADCAERDPVDLREVLGSRP